MPVDKHIYQKYWALMVFLALMVSFAFQGSRGLYETSEGRYAESAREMLETGNFLEPALGYEPHWTKPPMTYWAIAAGIDILGYSAWGVRLYNAAVFFLTVLAVAVIGTYMWDRRTGLVAGLVYLSSPFPAFGANAVTTDTLLAFCEICAVMCFIKAHRSLSKQAQEYWTIAMWFFFGLGFLTKGPPALLPLIPIFIWNYRNEKQISITNPAGMAVFFSVGLSWYIIVCRLHPGLLSYFIGTEVVDRIASNSVHNHKWYKPFMVYVPVLTLGAGYWLYPGLKTALAGRFFSPPVLLRRMKRNDYGAFLLLWLLIPLIVFFLVKSRLPLYVLPIYAPIALGIARVVCREYKTACPLRRIAGISLCSALVIIIAKDFPTYCHYHRDMKSLYETYLSIKEKNTIPILYEKRKLYGFQYYLNGPIVRIPDMKKKYWADSGGGDSMVNSYVFITDKRKADILFHGLTTFGLNCRRYESGDYVLYSVETNKVFLCQSLVPFKTS